MTGKSIPPRPSDFDMGQVVERPDGFYWIDKLTSEQFGPFATLLEARQDMKGVNDESLEEGETLKEAEAEIGISDWVDPETGQLAEDSAPHLSDE